MTNRLTSAARWFARSWVGRKVNRLTGGNQYWPDAAPKRKRSSGVLRAVLNVLVEGSATEHNVVLSGYGNYTGGQIKSALRYAARRGYIIPEPQTTGGQGEVFPVLYRITDAGGARLVRGKPQLERLTLPPNNAIYADGSNEE